MSADLAREALQRGDLEQVRTLLFQHLRNHPEDARARIFLFQFLTVEGDWDRAAKQLALCAQTEAEAVPLAAVYAPAIEAEKTRDEVFAGRRQPTFFGRPADWTAGLVHALKLDADGHGEAATRTRLEALEAADALPGTIDGRPFEWLADADARLGPVLELVIEGTYHWMPLEHVARLKLIEPTDLRDLVWMEAELTLTNGGQMAVLAPTRYPGAHRSADSAIRLARRTDWREIGEGAYAGEGQRMFATDSEDLAMMNVREITLAAAA